MFFRFLAVSFGNFTDLNKFFLDLFFPLLDSRFCAEVKPRLLHTRSAQPRVIFAICSNILSARGMFCGVVLLRTLPTSLWRQSLTHPHTHTLMKTQPCRYYSISRITRCYVLRVSSVLKYFVVPGDTPPAYYWFTDDDRLFLGQLCVLGFLQWLSDVFSFKTSLLSVCFLHNEDVRNSCGSRNRVLIRCSITAPKQTTQAVTIGPPNTPGSGLKVFQLVKCCSNIDASVFY